MKKIWLCLILSFWLSTSQSLAHDFWLYPEQYHLNEPGRTALSAKVGHGEEQFDWPMEDQRVATLISTGPTDGLVDQRVENSILKSGRPAEIKLRTEGLHTVLLESYRAFSELSAEKFNAYVEEEGLKDISRHRLSTGTEQHSGKEVYSRVGKTILRVGHSDISDDIHVTRPMGAILEITPSTNIYSGDSDRLIFKITWKGRALEAAKVHLINLNSDFEERTYFSQADGTISVQPIEDGEWMLHTVWGAPAEGLLLDADYFTVFSSLTFRVGN